MQLDGAKMETVARYRSQQTLTATGPSMAGPCSAPIIRPTRPWPLHSRPEPCLEQGGAASPMMGDPRRGDRPGPRGPMTGSRAPARPSGKGRTCGGGACVSPAGSLSLGKNDKLDYPGTPAWYGFSSGSLAQRSHSNEVPWIDTLPIITCCEPDDRMMGERPEEGGANLRPGPTKGPMTSGAERLLP